LCLCNKVPYILMESYYYLLSISLGYVFCLHMLCIKVYMKTSVGETHRDSKTRFDCENHKIQKAMDQEPRSPKLDRNGPWSGLLDLLYGPAGPSASPHASSMVMFDSNTLYFYMFRFCFEPN